MSKIHRIYSQILIIFCLTFLMFSSVILYAQDVSTSPPYVARILSGNVVDDLTGEPLSDVYIYGLLNKNIMGISDKNGLFSFEMDEVAFVFSMVGYSNDTVFCHELFCKTTVRLKPVSIMMDVKVVSAGRSPSSLKEATVSMETLKPYLIENKNTIRLDQAIDQIPGVQITDGQANIRSGSGWSYGAGSRVTVLLDDMPMMSGDAGQVLWSFLPVDNILQTEVIKGASSVLYGSSALNGIIHVRTVPPEKSLNGKITLFGGMFSPPPYSGWKWSERSGYQKGLSVYRGFKKHQNYMHVTLNSLMDDGYRMGNNDYRNRVGISLLRYHSPKLTLRLNANLLDGESGSFLLWQSLDSAYTALNRQTTTSKVLRYNVDPVITFQGKNTTQHVRGRYLFSGNKVDAGNPDVDQSNQSENYWGEYQLTHVFPKWNVTITTGALWSYTISNSPLFEGTKAAKNQAAFSQFEYRYRNWILHTGIRMERYQLQETTEQKPVARAGFSYKALPAGYLRSSIGQGYRFPTIAERYISTTVGPVSVLPNPQLAPETGWNIEIGYKQGVQVRKTRVLLDFSIFRMEYQNMMEFTFSQWELPSPSNPIGVGFKSVNVGNTRIDGAEFSYQWLSKVQKKMVVESFGGVMFSVPISLEPEKIIAESIFGSPLSYVNTSSNPESKILKYRSAVQSRWDIQLEYDRKQEWGVSYRYNSHISNMDAAFVQFPINVFVPGIQDGRRFSEKGMHFVDVRYGFYWAEKSLKASVIVNNVFNKTYMVRPADMSAPRLITLQIVFKM